MARVRKVILKPGVYRAPQGTLHATPERLRRWADTFRSMRSSGIVVPTAWGHQPGAEPCYEQDKARRQYDLSHYNAGYLEGMEVDPRTGDLVAVLDVPAAEGVDASGNIIYWVKRPDGTMVKGAIKEVSCGIRNWTDGRGRHWPDSIVHVALTPLPVVAGQGGFQTEPTPPGGQTLCLGLADYLYELGGAMPDDFDQDDDDKGGVAVAEPPADDAPPAPEEPSAKDALLKEVKDLLAAHGVSLPDDTDNSNFLEHLKVALHALKEGQNLDQGMGANADADADAGAPMEQEQRPIMMSTVSDPLVKKLLAKEQEAHKARQLKRIDRLVAAQAMRPTKAQQLRDLLANYELSLNDEGNAVEQRVDLELSIFDEVYACSPQARKASVKGATAERRPADRESDADQEIAKFAKEQAATVSRGFGG